MSVGFDWTETAMRQLRELWSDPANSAASIAGTMGCSKNAVVGKAHRMKLPGRPSPIHRASGAAPRPPAPRAVPPPILRPVTSRPVTSRPAPPPAAPAPPAAMAVPRPSPVRSCCWPEGEPGTPAFRFCGDPTSPGRPYCAPHCRAAYVPVSPRNAAHG